MNKPSDEVVAKWRSEFEPLVMDEAMRKNYGYMDFVLTKFVDGSYCTTWVDMMWEGFLMGLSTAVIELPSKESPEYTAHEAGYNLAISDAAMLIESQGYRVKRGA